MVFHEEYLRILAKSDAFAHDYDAGARRTAEIVRKVCVFQEGVRASSSSAICVSSYRQ
jgi:hypothetical protein